MRSVILPLLLLLGLDASAAEHSRVPDEVQAAERRFQAAVLASRLAPTSEQQARIAKLHEQAQGLFTRARIEAQPILAEQREAYSDFRRECARNLGFSPEVEKRTARAKERGQAAHKRFCDELGEIEERFLALLTPEQSELFAEPEPSSPEQEIRQELRDIGEEKHGAIGPAGRFLLGPQAAGSDEDIAGLREDIILWNLINGLGLTEKQLGSLLALAQQAGQAVAQIDPGQAAAYIEGLDRATEAIQQGQRPVPQRLAQLRRAGERLAGVRRGPRDGDARPAQAQAAKAVLTAAQTEVLLAFKPCLIPTRDLRDPVRVGQAGVDPHLVRQLERLRALPEQAWGNRRAEIVERVLAGLEQHGGRYDECERPARRMELQGFLDRVRAMDELDFELEQQALAEELAAFARERSLEAALAELTDRDQKLLERVRHFLLNPRALALYRERGESLRRPEDLGRTDLRKVTKAPHCSDGGCALED